MKKHSRINNIAELQAEIARLKVLKGQQENYLNDQYRLFNHKLDAPKRIFNSIKSSIPGVNLVEGIMGNFGKSLGTSESVASSDWLTKVMRVGLPFVMNKFFLKRAGIVKRLLVTVLSERAAGQVSQDKLTGLISKVTDFIKPKKRKKFKPLTPAEEDLQTGIPPYSETY